MEVENGTNLLSALKAEGVRAYSWPKNYWPLNVLGCPVEVVSGGDHLGSVSGYERFRLGHEAGRLRLADRCVVRGDVVIRIRP